MFSFEVTPLRLLSFFFLWRLKRRTEIELNNLIVLIHKKMHSLKIYYRVHKRLPLAPILRQINPVHTIPSYPPTCVLDFLLISFLLAFTRKSYIHVQSSSPFVLHALPISSSFTYNSIYIGRRVRVMKLLRNDTKIQI
jgi:hypothetical protein